VPQAEPLAGPSEGKGFVARAVICHHALDLNAEACVVRERRLEEGDGAALLLVGHDPGEGDARVIVDADVHVFPADAAAVALACAVAGDAVADLVELAKFFDVEVDQFAGMLALVTSHWFVRFQSAELVEAAPPQDATDRGGSDPELMGDLPAGVALAAQGLDRRARGNRCLARR